MIRYLEGLLLSVTLAAGAAALLPQAAAAQCKWGCACVGNACGCNSNGNGGRCDAGGSGCVVSGCQNEAMLYFAPDGSVIRLAFAEDSDAGPAESEAAVGAPQADLGGTTRWEAAPDGRSVARHCSGVILERYYGRDEAGAIRETSRTLTL